MTDEQAAAPAGKGLKVVGALLGCVALALLGCCLFAIVGSQLDTDFQRRQAEKKALGRTWVEAMRGKLAALNARLPAPGSLQGERKVPAELRAKVGEVILTDAAFLAAYKADGTVVATDSPFFHDDDLAALTDNFRDSTNLADWPESSVRASVDMVERMNQKGVVALFVPGVLRYPVTNAEGGGFQGGVAEGQLALLSLEDGALIAHGPFRAESSDTVRVRGGVGIRFRRVRLGSLGGGDAEEAILRDFMASCNQAIEDTVARLKAP